MDPIRCFQECRSGVVQIFLERDHQKIGSDSGAGEFRVRHSNFTLAQEETAILISFCLLES